MAMATAAARLTWLTISLTSRIYLINTTINLETSSSTSPTIKTTLACRATTPTTPVLDPKPLANLTATTQVGGIKLTA